MNSRNPWDIVINEPPRGTTVWRAFFRDRASFTFGLHVGYDEDAARLHAEQWGDAFAVEVVK